MSPRTGRALLLLVTLGGCGEPTGAETTGPIARTTREYHVVGVRVGHDLAARSLIANGIVGHATTTGAGEILDGADFTLTGDRLTLTDVLGPASLEAETQSLDADDVEVGIATPSGELAAFTTRDPRLGSEAGLLLAGRAGSRGPSGRYHLRGFRLSLTETPSLVAEVLTGTIEFDETSRYSISATSKRSEWDTFADSLWVVDEQPVSDSGAFTVQADGAVQLGDAAGFVALDGELVAIADRAAERRGLLVALRQASDFDSSELFLPTSLAGFWLELEGRHIAPVTMLGDWTLMPASSDISADIVKQKWVAFPSGATGEVETAHLTPSPEYSMAPDGSFLEGTTQHALSSRLDCALYLIDYDILSTDRNESVRGFLLGLLKP